MTLTVGKLARAARVGIETVRFYERRGLVEPESRLPSGYRLYSEASVSRIRFIRNAQRLGFTLSEISELIELETRPTVNCGVVQKRALDKISAIEHKISDLQKMKRALEVLAQCCDSDRPIRECALMECMTS